MVSLSMPPFAGCNGDTFVGKLVIAGVNLRPQKLRSENIL